VAERWRGDLLAEGYDRVGCFTGQTETDERRRLNRAWQRDEIDIMVANSAFGLGVDKPDIRTIIHAALPETVDRYYQEVGRGGRDGCSAFGLVCLEGGDIRVPEAMLSSAVISTENAIDRLRGMLDTGVPTGIAGNQFLVDMNAVPHSRPDMRQGDLHREWNEHSLLLAQRAGLVTIVDSRPPALESEQGAPPRALLEVEFTNADAFRGVRSELHPLLDRARTVERDEISNTIAELDELIRRFVDGAAEPCLGHEFASLYPDCALACGGCPSCRRGGVEPYADPSDVILENIESDLTLPGEFHPRLSLRLGTDQRMTVEWGGQRSITELRGMSDFIANIVHLGIQQVVLPDSLVQDRAWAETLCKSLAGSRIDAHVLLTVSWIRNRWSRPVFSVPTLIVYPPDDAGADQLYQSIQSRPELRHTALISVVHKYLTLGSLGGLFRDKVNGIVMNLTGMEKLVDQIVRPVLR
jgi:hypothetical protein